MTTQESLLSGLESHNQAVNEAVRCRLQYLNTNMHHFAKAKAGDVVFDSHGRKRTVSSVCRYHEGNPEYDTSFNIYYRFEDGGNSSGEEVEIYTPKQWAAICKSRAKYALQETP